MDYLLLALLIPTVLLLVFFLLLSFLKEPFISWLERNRLLKTLPSNDKYGD